MYRFLTSAFLAIFTLVYVRAQPDYTKQAYDAYTAIDLKKASELIEKATQVEALSSKAQTWYYRGMIYQHIVVNKLEASVQGNLDPLDEAARSYAKALTMNTSDIDKEDLEKRYRRISNRFFQDAVNQYNSKDYATSLSRFQSVRDIAAYFGETDSLAIFNMALCYENMGDNKMAIEAYRKCVDIGYKAQNSYYFLITLLTEEGRTGEALATSTEAIGKFPNDQNLLISELNLLLSAGRAAEAIPILSRLIELNPTNQIYYYTRATILEDQGDTSSAREDYIKALDLKPDFFEALYNLGASYYNEGADMRVLANEVADPVKYKEYKAKIDVVLTEAVAYLERARAIQPDNRSTLESLKSLYALTNQTDKYEEIKAKLEGG